MANARTARSTPSTGWTPTTPDDNRPDDKAAYHIALRPEDVAFLDRWAFNFTTKRPAARCWSPPNSLMTSSAKAAPAFTWSRPWPSTIGWGPTAPSANLEPTNMPNPTPPLDPREPDYSREGVFIYHNCSGCADGKKHCIKGKAASATATPSARGTTDARPQLQLLPLLAPPTRRRPPHPRRPPPPAPRRGEVLRTPLHDRHRGRARGPPPFRRRPPPAPVEGFWNAFSHFPMLDGNLGWCGEHQPTLSQEKIERRLTEGLGPR